MRAPGFEPGSLGLKRVLNRFVKVENTGEGPGLLAQPTPAFTTACCNSNSSGNNNNNSNSNSNRNIHSNSNSNIGLYETVSC